MRAPTRVASRLKTNVAGCTAGTLCNTRRRTCSIEIVDSCPKGCVMRSPKLALCATMVLLSVAGAGCASQGTKPTTVLTKAHTLVEQADKSGTAQRYAAADLQRAHDELSDADRLSAQGEYREARAQAQRAAVDADLSVARGNEGEQQKAAQDISKANSALRQQAQRDSSAGNTP